jgi:hypothetical protein
MGRRGGCVGGGSADRPFGGDRIEGALCATVATWADGEARVWVTTCTDVDAVGELCAGPCLETFRSGLSARLASVNSDVRWPAYAAQCRTRGVLSVATSR